MVRIAKQLLCQHIYTKHKWGGGRLSSINSIYSRCDKTQNRRSWIISCRIISLPVQGPNSPPFDILSQVCFCDKKHKLREKVDHRWPHHICGSLRTKFCPLCALWQVGCSEIIWPHSSFSQSMDQGCFCDILSQIVIQQYKWRWS